MKAKCGNTTCPKFRAIGFKANCLTFEDAKNCAAYGVWRNSKGILVPLEKKALTYQKNQPSKAATLFWNCQFLHNVLK